MTPFRLASPLWLLTVFAGGFVLREASTISVWILSSFFLFALLDPWIQRLVRKGIGPVFSALGLVSLVTVFSAAGAAVTYRFSADLEEEFATYRKTVVSIYDSASVTLSRELDALSRSGSGTRAVPRATNAPTTSAAHSPMSGEVGASVVRGLGSAFTAILFLLLCPVLTFFIIAERKALASVFGRLFEDKARGEAMWRKITEATGAFFLGNLVICIISFPVFCIVFWLFGVTTPYALAAAASILNLIPFLGAGLSSLLPVLHLLSQQEASASLALALVFTCILIHFAVANLVTPKILGSRVDLNATTSTIALIVWGEILGGVGLLLAIPITATIKFVFQFSQSPQLQWFALLMSDDPESLLNQTNRQFPLNREVVSRLTSVLGIKVASPPKAPNRNLPE